MAYYHTANLTADPPTTHHPHLTRALTQRETQSLVAAYLARSTSHPALHPDAVLTSAGVKHGPRGGTQGGITLHYLRRVEAGLRGENLAAESAQELALQFGEESGIKAVSHQDIPEPAEVPEGDDNRLDAVMAASSTTTAPAPASEKKRKRHASVEAWSHSTSSAAPPSSKPQPQTQNIDADPDWQSPTSYATHQIPLQGEIGARSAPAEVAPQPVVVAHDAAGKVQAAPKSGKKGREGGKDKSEYGKLQRKRAKKARRMEEKRGATGGVEG